MSDTPKASVSALPSPSVWRPEMAIRLMLGQADKYQWVWAVTLDERGHLAVIHSDMPPGALGAVLLAANSQVAGKYGRSNNDSNKEGE